MGLKTTSDIIQELTVIVLETVEEAGSMGAPGGPLYLAMNHHGVDLQSFLIYMGSLVRLGFMKHVGDCYIILPKGSEFIRNKGRTEETTRRQSGAVV